MSGTRIGVVGVGRLGAAHARVLAESPAFELVGVHDREPAVAESVARGLGVLPFDGADLFAAIDAAVIAVPTAAHFELASESLRAGCHTLVEKPLASTLDEADRLVELAAESSLVLGVGHVERFNGVLLAAEPWLGHPRFIESLRLAPFQSRGIDVTVVLDLMIHDIDLVLTLTNAPLTEIHAVGVPVITQSIDLANARLVFEDGTVANITASRVSLKSLRQLRLFQESGYFSLDLGAGTGEHHRRRDPESSAGGMDADRFVERIPLDAGSGEPLTRELDAFARAIAGEPSRLVSGQAGRQALDVAIRITREIEEFVHVVTKDP